MMQIDCPHCGPRAQIEFTYERTVDSVVLIEAAHDEAMKRLYERGNPRGIDDEIWRHTFGCRAWMVLRRNRVTHGIESVQAVGPVSLP